MRANCSISTLRKAPDSLYDKTLNDTGRFDGCQLLKRSFRCSVFGVLSKPLRLGSFLLTENRKLKTYLPFFFLSSAIPNISSRACESAPPQSRISCSERKHPMQTSLSLRQHLSTQGDGTGALLSGSITDYH